MNKAHGVPVFIIESQIGRWQEEFARNNVAKSAFCKILRTRMESESDSIFLLVLSLLLCQVSRKMIIYSARK